MPLVRLLVAEDDRASLLLLSRLLEGWGYQVFPVTDGLKALEALQVPDAPRLAILDWMMPGMTGPAVCRELRQLRHEPYTYVLLLTSRSERQDVIEGMDSGADDYVTKPFDSKELQVRLRAGRRILELQAELVAAREALRDQATRDPLTRLWNRYAIFEALERELARAGRETAPLAVLMADLDHFKRVNDHYGHLTGDAVLREAARRMSGCLRSYDYVGRYGGEEFLIVLPGSTAEIAAQLAERIRWAVARRPIPVGETQIEATLSDGVSAATGIETRSEDLIRKADRALYRAKHLGRNRVEWVETQQVLA